MIKAQGVAPETVLAGVGVLYRGPWRVIKAQCVAPETVLAGVGVL